MRTVSRNEIVTALRAAGLQAGDTVLVHSDISRIGMLEGCGTREAYLTELLACYREVLGETGTIVAPTFTYSYGSGKPFVLESSPSELDVFSEFVRTRPGAMRSLHPMYSFAALGPAANDLCDQVGRAAFGIHSVFDRLVKSDARMLNFGTDLHGGFTIVHYIEHMAGVSYRYHKAFFGPVSAEGRDRPGPYYAFVRYLGKVTIHLQPFAQHLMDKGLVREQPLGMGGLRMVTMAQVLHEGLEVLQDNPCFLIREPFYCTD